MTTHISCGRWWRLTYDGSIAVTTVVSGLVREPRYDGFVKRISELSTNLGMSGFLATGPWILSSQRIAGLR